MRSPKIISLYTGRAGRKRKHVRPRCEVCALHTELCVCAELRPVELATRLIVIQHSRERHKPTNTARLLLHLVTGARLVHYGLRDEPTDMAGLLATAADACVLYPREAARVLEAAASPPERPRTLIVLDGTWRQARRLAGRIPEIAALPFVTLPSGAASSWPVRRTPNPAHLCTFEAVVRAVALLEGAEAARPLADAFARVVHHLDAMKRGAVSEVRSASAMPAQVADVEKRQPGDR